MPRLLTTLLLFFLLAPTRTLAGDDIVPLALWPDRDGRHINAHGGGIFFHKGHYYWYGEDKDKATNAALTGVSCYRSRDLAHWTRLSTALSVDTVNESSPIARGCIIERPKVIYNPRTKTFVMWFHLELKGRGYAAAYAAVATSRRPEGPFSLHHAGRVNAGRLPYGTTAADSLRLMELNATQYNEWWTPAWRRAIREGLFLKRDLEGGQMARDMTLFTDSDGTAYHIYASEDNLTLHIAALSDDYLTHSGRYTRVAAGAQSEAPAIFRHGGRYWLICSGCTGWAPNAARLFSAPTIWGPWSEDLGNPCTGRADSALTFGGQGTYILPVERKGRTHFIFMADVWRPQHPSDGRYLWLPIAFGADGRPQIPWRGKWSVTHLLSGRYDSIPAPGRHTGLLP